MDCGQHGDQWAFISNKMTFSLIIAKSKVQGSPNFRIHVPSVSHGPWQTASKTWILGAWKGDELNCNERDELFNSIFTTASITFGVGAFCFGLLADRFGIFVGRLTSFSFVSVGLSVLILILKRIIPEVRISFDQFHVVLTQFSWAVHFWLEPLRFYFRIHGYG